MNIHSFGIEAIKLTEHIYKRKLRVFVLFGNNYKNKKAKTIKTVINKAIQQTTVS